MAHSDDARLGIGGNFPPEVTLPDRLAETHADALKRLDAVAERANKLPKDIVTAEDLAAVADCAADAHAEWKALDGKRVEEKEPYLKGGREVDGFFRDPLARADRIEKALTQRVTLFNRAKKKKEDDERAAAEKVARDAAAAAQKAAEDAAAAGRIEDAMADVEYASEATAKADEIAQAPRDEPAPFTTDSGTSIGTTAKWTFEITDLAKLDLEAIRPFLRTPAIEQALRDFIRINKNARQIAGVRIFEDDTAKIRR